MPQASSRSVEAGKAGAEDGLGSGAQGARAPTAHPHLSRSLQVLPR